MINLSRRGFFGAIAGAAAAPAAAKSVVDTGAADIRAMALDIAPHDVKAAVLYEPGFTPRLAPPFAVPSARDCVYRTGNPHIDCLRSISGVYKAMMEKKQNGGADA